MTLRASHRHPRAIPLTRERPIRPSPNRGSCGRPHGVDIASAKRTPSPVLGRSNAMAANLRQRLTSDESGFTLIELLVVIIILGILLAIEIGRAPCRERGSNAAVAQAYVKAAVPGI